MISFRPLIPLIAAAAAMACHATPLADLFNERLKSVVAVEFFVQAKP